MMLLKFDVYDVKIKHNEDKIPNITSVATTTALNVKTNGVKNKISNIATNLDTTTPLTAVKNKIPNVSNYVTKD